jgi:hypothetical protein
MGCALRKSEVDIRKTFEDAIRMRQVWGFYDQSIPFSSEDKQSE